jgi:hypothetical protein
MAGVCDDEGVEAGEQLGSDLTGVEGVLLSLPALLSAVINTRRAGEPKHIGDSSPRVGDSKANRNGEAQRDGDAARRGEYCPPSCELSHTKP